MSELDVVIVGAGSAGLTAAYFLQQNDYNVQILEANNIFGGRLRKDTSLGWPIDIGGEWIHLETGDYDNPNELFREIYERDFNLNTVLDPKEISYYITDENKIYSEAVEEVTDFRWKDGTWWDFLNTEVAAKLDKDTVVLDCVVEEIDYSSDNVITSCANGQSYTSKQVIVTASIEVLRSGDIAFVPDMPQNYKNALVNFDMGPALKAFLEFSEQFYPESPVVVDTDADWYQDDDMTARNFGERGFYDETFGKDTDLNIMGFFVYGLPAEYYSAKGTDFVIDDIIGELDDMYNGTASDTFIRGIVQDWPEQPYVKTAYTKHVKNDDGTIDQLKRPINGKVYFAGEALPDNNSDWGFAHGAALSGKRAANQIIGKSSSDQGASNGSTSASSSRFMVTTSVVTLFAVLLI